MKLEELDINIRRHPQGVYLVEIMPEYFLKYDGLRDQLMWTSIGPNGRICDCSSRETAIDLINEAYENET